MSKIWINKLFKLEIKITKYLTFEMAHQRFNKKTYILLYVHLRSCKSSTPFNTRVFEIAKKIFVLNQKTKVFPLISC